MKINRNELREALEIVKPGLAKKEEIEQSTSFAFVNGYVLTYNDEISILHPVENLKITGVVLADQIYKFLLKTKTEDVFIEEGEGELFIKSGKAKAGFSFSKEVKLPLIENLNKAMDWSRLPEKFVESVDFAAMGCSTDLTNPKLICVHVNKAGFVESCDNIRIIHCKLNDHLQIDTFLIPGVSSRVAMKINPTEIASNTGWVHFRNDFGTIISCRTFNEEFVNTSLYLNETNGKSITLPDNLKDILDRASIFQEKSNISEPFVSIEILENKIRVSCDSNSSWFEESAQIDYSGDEISISVFPQLLKDILLRTKKCIFQGNRLLFISDDSSWLYLTTVKAK